MTASNPRRKNAARRDKLRRYIAAEGKPCALCGLPIDYTLPAGHPLSYELDEIVPVSLGGSPFDESNVQPAHRICNARRQNKTVAEWKAKQALKGSQSAFKPCITTTSWD